MVWRGGSALRALTVGSAVGLPLGALAWLDSGFMLSGVIVLLVSGGFYGIWMAHRVARYWPSAKELCGDDRVAVARTVRRGKPVTEARLCAPVIDYSRALHSAAETGRWSRWVLAIILVVATAAGAWDALHGSWGNTAASAIYLLALLVEFFWFPKRKAQLLANADHTSASARKCR